MELQIGDSITVDTPFGSGPEALAYVVDRIDGDRVHGIYKSSHGYAIEVECPLRRLDPTMFGWLLREENEKRRRYRPYHGDDWKRDVRP